MNPSPYPVPFTSAHGRARIVKLSLLVGAVATGLSLLAEGVSLGFPPLTEGQELGDNPIGAAVSLAIFLLALVEFVIYWATVVLFLMWLYRAYDAVRVFNPWNRLNYSRGLALGSFFIPFMNLIVPYRVVKEIWQKSGTPDEALLSEPNPPGWFPAWWLFLDPCLGFREPVDATLPR
jgi:hypothetical protein